MAPSDFETLLVHCVLADQASLRQLFARARTDSDQKRLIAEAELCRIKANKRLSLRPTAELYPGLPISQRRDEIAALIKNHQITIICGETGSGKTTQLPLICLQLGLGTRGQIAHTQPRRIAARAVAARIAEEVGTQVGPATSIGCKVRFGDESSPLNTLKLMTDGMLLAETQQDRDLLAYDTIIIDEAHERSLNIDFLLGYLKQLIARRPDLKIIITSATIDPQRFSNHFGGPAVAPVIEVSGRTYPVEVRYRAPARQPRDEFEQVDDSAIVRAIEELCDPTHAEGDILVFLPGEKEIRFVESRLQRERLSVEILPLFSRLTATEQHRIFARHTQQRVILATNIAETSLTIPGIRYVIDTGVARINRYDFASKVQRLPIEPISRASAAQRSGRCGRVSAGIAIRLYAETDFNQRPLFTQPEVLRSSLAGVILQMKSLDLGAIEAFPFLELPSEKLIKDGYTTLHELGAITLPSGDGKLTDIGRRLVRLPLEPRIGRIVIAGSDEGCLSEALILASVLSIQDPRERPQGRQDHADQAHSLFTNEASDFLTLLNIFHAWRDTHKDDDGQSLRAFCRDNYLSWTRMREWLDTHAQLRSMAREMGLTLNAEPASADSIHRAMLAGLIANVACREDGSGREYTAAGGATVSIHPSSVYFKRGPRWFVASEIVETSRLYARNLASIDPLWLVTLGSHLLKRTFTDAHFHAEGGEVTAWERATLFDLVVIPRQRVPLAQLDPAAARKIFLSEGLAANALTLDAPFVHHNQRILDTAQAAEAKARKRGILKPADQLAQWFDSRLPASVVDVATLQTFLATAPPTLLNLQSSDVLNDTSLQDESTFPSTLPLGNGCTAQLSYRFEPGKEADGVTATIILDTLPALEPQRVAWLVAGWLPDLVAALLKQLPKQYRNRLPQDAENLNKLAYELAAVMTFGEGAIGDALSEALEVLASIQIPAADWNFSALPDHLRMRLQIIDHRGEEVAAGRDPADLQNKLASRAKRALAAAARNRFEQSGLTQWSFGELPDQIEVDDHTQYPAIIDEGSSIGLTLYENPAQAQAATHRGIRRLFALATYEELSHRVDSIADIADMRKHFGQMGTAEELTGSLIDLIAERTFIEKQTPIRTAAAFEERLHAQWGRLGQATSEIAGMVAELLEARAWVAHRLSGGTPKLWIASVTDIREHAAFLMPPGFLRNAPLDRLREYPRYVRSMKRRLETLRENGVASETKPLADLAPHWKRFTAWVNQGYTAAKAEADRAAAEGITTKAAAPAAKGKAAIPSGRAKRNIAVVPSDSAEWAMRPGSIPATLLPYRWALEDFRVCLFTPDLGGPVVTAKKLEELWVAAKI